MTTPIPVDGGPCADPTHDPDPDAPRDPHDTHAWTYGPRWGECTACGARDHWIGATVRCPGTKVDDAAISIDAAIACIRADIERFRVWWLGRGLGTTRPTLAEWRAEAFEFARANGASAPA